MHFEKELGIQMQQLLMIIAEDKPHVSGTCVRMVWVHRGVERVHKRKKSDLAVAQQN